MNKLALLAIVLVSLAALASPVMAYSDDDWGYDYSYSPYGSSGSCCCGPTFILLAGAAMFAYAHQRN
ncbi:MAG TPA: hypothetical protein PKJ97_01950 [Candidatus Bilamarchaeaceae archaeon]|nr:hypothetical protein [Candidatus Bilamarchaeaceae archaeon]